MQTLIINAMPCRCENSISSQLLATLTQRLPDASILDLYQMHDLPALDTQGLGVFFKMQSGTKLSEDERKIAEKRTALLAQFKAHKRIVMLYPMFNYNIPAKLKDYLDNVLVPRETFRYSEDGKLTGLLNDGREVLFIQTSGSIFSGNSEFAELEFAHFYLDAMFKKLGFEIRRLVRAEGSAILPKETVLKKAQREIDAVLAN
ncbi:FMN-dependent NADH-azoreductase [Necropsobacter massiliensis]|uniref:FMN-dependent NADH-azoreductase n=1 Tax=Necropsobacter massiliensis TaxID=1400001 RepID=UPI000595D238|nr:NAD(P)H-dependent oxidoreductase [Necropsobacter massiliensis]